jgi:hypothetical protein
MKLPIILLLAITVISSGCGVSEEESKQHRDLATWVIEQGGSVFIESTELNYKKTESLPEGGFTVSRINLNSTKITDKDLIKLKEISDLKRLGLHSTKVTDKGMVTIAELSSLEELELSNTSLTDKGLEKLSGLSNLKKLFINQTGVTKAGIESVQSKLSGCKIIHIQ